MPPSFDQQVIRRTMRTGVTGHNREKAEQGYVLYTPLGGPGRTLLIDMAGETVHEWTHDRRPGLYGDLLPNGNLLYGAKIRDETWDIFAMWKAFKGGEIREVAPDGTVVWRHADPMHHHDQRRTDAGTTLYLSLEKVPDELEKRIHGGHPPPDGKGMYADMIVEVDAAGAEIWRWRAIEHLDPELERLSDSEPRWEWTHGNTVAPLGDDRVVFSMRATSTIGIIDKASDKVVWRYRVPQMGGQHDPRPLPNGNLLVYDNGTQRRWMGVLPHSRVFEIDPRTDGIVWEYTDTPPFNFYSQQISGAVRLPGGNTLICEGARGRLFQVTPEGETVWEFINPVFGETVMGFDVNMVFRAFFYTREELPFL